MPLSRKGKKIRKAMREFYGKEKGDQVFYASENAIKINGLTSLNPKKKKRKNK